MKKIKLKEIVLSVFIFTLAALFIVGEGLYSKTVKNDSASFTIDFTGKAADPTKPIVFDIAKEGLPKRLVQPGNITISTGHGNGIVNKGSTSVLVQITTEGFSSDVDVSSTIPSFVKQTGKFTEDLKPGAGLNASLILNIPRSQIKQNSVSSGNIVFTDYKSGELLAKVPVNVVNSSVSEKK